MDTPAQKNETPAQGPAYGIVKGRHGLFYVNPRDIYVGLGLVSYGEYCEVEWQFMRRFIKAGDHVIDAGANMGAFALPMARHVGPQGSVMAFEPQPEIFSCLQSTAHLNKMPQLQVLQKGLGATAGILDCAGINYNELGHFAGHSLLEKGHDMQVEIMRVDDVFVAPRLSFMKIDVEGMEQDVLKGGSHTIRRDRPVLYIENDKLDKSKALIEELFGLDYACWWHTTPMFNPHNYNKNSENLYGRVHNINMVCLPRDRLPELQDKIPKSMLPVANADDQIDDGAGKGLRRSYADDVTGI